jgi:hypothetical protein
VPLWWRVRPLVAVGPGRDRMVPEVTLRKRDTTTTICLVRPPHATRWLHPPARSPPRAFPQCHPSLRGVSPYTCHTCAPSCVGLACEFTHVRTTLVVLGPLQVNKGVSRILLQNQAFLSRVRQAFDRPTTTPGSMNKQAFLEFATVRVTAGPPPPPHPPPNNRALLTTCSLAARWNSFSPGHQAPWLLHTYCWTYPFPTGAVWLLRSGVPHCSRAVHHEGAGGPV